MVQRSPELCAVVQRWLTAIQDNDAATIKNLFSASDHARYVGSDAAEVWAGSGVRDALPLHIAEVPTLKLATSIVEAYEEGPVGWATAIGTVTNVETHTFDLRITWVCVLEAGAWRIIQVHVSVPVPNLQLVGRELTSGLEALLVSLGSTAPQVEGTMTIMFTDIADSTPLSEMLADTAWAELIQKHHQTVATAVVAHGGRVVKTLGDGTMATFESARGALRAALQIQRHAFEVGSGPPLQVRVGVHTGDVVHTPHDFLGHAVNKAARIASMADGGQTMVSQVTRELVGSSGEFTFGEASTCNLKGLEGPHVVVPLLG